MSARGEGYYRGQFAPAKTKEVKDGKDFFLVISGVFSGKVARMVVSEPDIDFHLLYVEEYGAPVLMHASSQQLMFLMRIR